MHEQGTRGEGRRNSGGEEDEEEKQQHKDHRGEAAAFVCRMLALLKLCSTPQLLFVNASRRRSRRRSTGNRLESLSVRCHTAACQAAAFAMPGVWMSFCRATGRTL
eukprot:9468241-Pyramimonas_sp.AAC.1